jgi:hypothetical protein
MNASARPDDPAGLGTCLACEHLAKATKHCKSRACDWWTCGNCGATNGPHGWNQPTEFAGSLPASKAWAKRHGISVWFTEVKKP